MATLVATVDPGNAPPRILLELDWTGQTSVQVTRRDPDGRSRPVRTGEPARLTSGLWLAYDYESPFGVPVTYTATAGATTVSSATVQLDVTDVWLRHPGIPSLSVTLTIRDLGQVTRDVRRGIFTPVGRSTPIVVTDGRRKTPESTITVATSTLQQSQRMDALLDDASVLLLDVPPGNGWGIEHLYMSIGQTAQDRRVRHAARADRDWTLPYIEVDRPAGGQAPQRTYGDVLAAHATYADVKVSYASYRDLLLGRLVGAPTIPVDTGTSGTFGETFTGTF